MKAKQYLEQVRYLDDFINAKVLQVYSLRKLGTNAVAAFHAMSDSPAEDKEFMEDLIARILLLESEIDSDIDTFVDMKCEVFSVISKVDDGQCRQILEKRYLNFEQWERVAADMDMSVADVYFLHYQALKMVAEVLRNSAESNPSSKGAK